MSFCTIEKANEIVKAKFEKASLDLNLKCRGFVMPTVIWRAMGVRVAGYCNYTENKIELNTNYLNSTDWENFLDDTPLHELAHAISYQLYGDRGHKHTWKNVSYALGLGGNRCHHFSRPINPKNTRVRKRYSAHCSCMEHIITSIKYNRIQKGLNYICKKCRTRLVLD